jgi:TfoX/Sxy family transcriptional regulator of competence genes
MAYDEKLAARIRKVLSTRDDVVEKRMFGGLCFLVKGAMCCGITSTDFMVRVGPEQFEKALAEPHTRPMDFTGRPSKGAVYVSGDGLRTDRALVKWVRRGIVFATAQPRAKSGKTRTKRTSHRNATPTPHSGASASASNPRRREATRKRRVPG